MKICKTIESFIEARNLLQGTVGFVPTMGALHQGHLRLIEAAKKRCDHVIVSIFVNPTQFLAGEDLDQYPRREESDRSICERAGVAVVFMPQADMMYEADEPMLKAPDLRSYILEGAQRPGHFDGVLQVVLKLLNLSKADYAFFGKKDAQQLFLIRQMVARFFIPVEIVAIETVRELDGLALSSRNVYLSASERKEALLISQALRSASSLITSGARSVEKIELHMLEILRPLDVNYCICLNRDFHSIDMIEVGNTIILVAVEIGTTRLIDNIWV